MRAVWVFAPIALFAVFVAVRALAGRPLSRRALDVSIALILLAYLAVTAGLGVFWVSRMDLPVFDWHYLFGYALLVVAAAHVSLQLKGLVRFFRPRTTRSGPQASRERPAWRSPGALTALTGVSVVLAAGLLLRQKPDARSVTQSFATIPALPAEDARPLVDRLVRESSYSRSGLFRSLALAPARPPDVKPYPGHPRTALRDAEPLANLGLSRAFEALRRSERPVTRAPSLAELGTVLFHANGVTARTGDYALRAAASSGALYPTDVYVLARAVDGLAPGAYYYDGPRHELVHVGGPERVEAATAALPDMPGFDEAPVAFVLGGTFDRTAWKYTVRSYRYLGLDAGHVALNLAAAALGTVAPCRPVAAFDDLRLASALGFDASVEAPLLALVCGGSAPSSLPSVSPRRKAASIPADADAIELTRLSSHLTSWALTGGFDWLRPPPVPRPAPVRALHAAVAAEEDLFQVIRRRRSFREFDPAPVPAAAFAGVLAEAASGIGWTRGVPLVELFVAVRAVEGIPPGTYRYDAGRHALSEPLQSGVPAIEAAGLDQALLGRAAFVLAWALLDERAGTLEGARDFRHACLDAGVSGEAAYLAATGRDLGICGVGAFYDAEVASLFASQGRAPRVIHLAGVGMR